jgi:hypothetical protein
LPDAVRLRPFHRQADVKVAFGQKLTHRFFRDIQR